VDERRVDGDGDHMMLETERKCMVILDRPLSRCKSGGAKPCRYTDALGTSLVDLCKQHIAMARREGVRVEEL